MVSAKTSELDTVIGLEVGAVPPEGARRPHSRSAGRLRRGGLPVSCQVGAPWSRRGITRLGWPREPAEMGASGPPATRVAAHANG
jgi:hypothetical protein